MALINCKECGKEVSTEAVACPHCGAKQPKQVKPVKVYSGKEIAVITMTALIIGVIMVRCMSPGEDIPAAPAKNKIADAYNPVARWGAEKVAAANKVMDMVKHDCNVFEDNGDLVVEMRNYMDDRNALLKYVRAIADTDVILHGAARPIYYYDPSGKKIAKADTTYGVRLEN